MSLPVLEVRHTLDRLSANLGLLAEERMAAAVRALNRTMTTVRAQSARELKGEYPGATIAELKKRIKLERATRRSPAAALVFSGRRMLLFDRFGMRGVGRWGVRFRGLPWRVETISGEPVTADMLARAFRQRSRRTGRADVFTRLGPRRESFEILVAPGVARALAERKLDEVIARAARGRFEVVFQQEANFRLSKR
jgi:hypothetical protein